MKKNISVKTKLKLRCILLTLFCLMVVRNNYLNAQCSASLYYNNVSCFGSCDGSAQASALTGTSPYTYLWSSGSTYANTYGINTGLCPGTYTLTVKDATGCLSITSVTITEPTKLKITTTIVKNINCFGDCDGKIVATATGGNSSKYSYTWVTWGGGISGATASNLCATAYTVEVNDADGCRAYTFSPSMNYPIKIGVTTSTTPETIGQNNGSASFLVNGGSTLASYSWSNGSLGNPITGLSCGTYSVTVTDNNGCTGTGLAFVACVTGVNELNDGLSFSIYPNPATNTIAIETILNKPFTIELTNLLGETIFNTQESATNKIIINVGILPKGIYLVEIMDKDNNTSGRQRLVVQ